VLHEGIAIGYRVAAESARFTHSAHSLGPRRRESGPFGTVGVPLGRSCAPGQRAANDQRGRGRLRRASLGVEGPTSATGLDAPGHARQGLGKALLDTATDWAQQHGLTALTLTTYAHVPWSAPFFERLGFAILTDAERSGGLRRIRGDDPAQPAASTSGDV
jgi:GNAT superfamily N-acetyltransferase